MRFSASAPPLVALSFVTLLAGCSGRSEPQIIEAEDASAATATAPELERARIESVVTRFGNSLKTISVLSPDAARTMKNEWGELVAQPLLERWAADPPASPGRQTSSPWPDRIEIDQVELRGGKAIVSGRIVEASSSGDTGGRPATLGLERSGGTWMIVSFETLSEKEEAASEGAVSSADVEEAVAVVEGYYAAIDEGRWDDAWNAWAEGALDQTQRQFELGYAQTESVRVETGSPSSIEAAAGSHFVRIPVTITATTSTGETQHFVGTYVLRRGVADGASDAQRQWRLHSAAIRESSGAAPR